ncbi:MAG: hypothetical protein V7K48_10955 [Nostoc sp.]|uniref:hypothetical protein n=1 Tax=Nostoc sp. TaxID=1180 RepID=UPI002FF98832
MSTTGYAYARFVNASALARTSTSHWWKENCAIAADEFIIYQGIQPNNILNFKIYYLIPEVRENEY